MSAAEDKTFEAGPDRRSILALATLYFVIVSVYCALFLWRRFATDTWPQHFSLWYLRILIRTVAHWIALAACFGFLRERLWAKTLMIWSTGTLALLYAAYLVKRFVTELWLIPPRLGFLPTIEAAYNMYAYQFFTFFITAFFFFYFRSWHEERS